MLFIVCILNTLLAMEVPSGSRVLLPLMGVILMLSSAPLLVRAVQCPAESVSVDNGTLTYRPLSPGTETEDPVYNAGAIGGWYSLASGFVDVVRSGSLPYGE